MTVYLLIALSWLLVGLAMLVLRLVREPEPEHQWRLVLGAAAAPFVLYPVVTMCSTLLGTMVARVPFLNSLWPLVWLGLGGAVVGLSRSVVLWRRQRALLAACERPEPDTARSFRSRLRRLSRAAGLRRVPRLLLYPRGAYVWTVGGRRPAIVVSHELVSLLSEDEFEAVLGHEVAHLRQRDYLLNWLGVLIRSVLFYLPPWSIAWHVLAEARERRADRSAVGYTGDPLALAAALIKVWRHQPARPVAVGALGLIARSGSLEARIRCLLDPDPPRRRRWRSWVSAGLLLGGFLIVQTTVEGGTHVLARVNPEVGAWEQCCDPEVSPLPHCLPPRRFLLAGDTIACSRPSERRALAWTSSRTV